MYLNIGKNRMIRKDAVIGIFDLDNCSQSRWTRDFLSAAEKSGRVVNAAEDIPNSFLLCQEEDGVRVYLSQSSARTLWKRNDQIF